jgi:hypothetical protein
MQTNPQTSMTEQEQALFAQFSAQARKQLKTMSKNQLVQTCVALLIDNYGLKGALEQYMLQKRAQDAPPAPAPMDDNEKEQLKILEAADIPKKKRTRKSKKEDKNEAPA